MQELKLHSQHLNEELALPVYCSKPVTPLFYHSIGIKETEVKTTDGAVRNFIEPNRALAHVLQAKQARYHYHEFDGDHSWTYWQPDLPIGLKKVIEM